MAIIDYIIVINIKSILDLPFLLYSHYISTCAYLTPVKSPPPSD